LTAPLNAGPLDPVVVAIVPDAVFVESAWADAITAMLPEEVGCDGAVYGIGEPFGQPETEVAVTAGTAGEYGVFAVAGISGRAGSMIKNPHPLAQTCQSTPALLASFATAAVRFTIVFVWTCAGSEGTKLTDGVVFGLIVIGFEMILTLGSAAEVAVMVTDVPADVTGGAV
jgi:hypothetical protein